MYSSSGGGAPSPRASQVPTLSLGTPTDSGGAPEMVGGTVMVRWGSSPGRPDASPASTRVGRSGGLGTLGLSNSFSLGIVALGAGFQSAIASSPFSKYTGESKHH